MKPDATRGESEIAGWPSIAASASITPVPQTGTRARDHRGVGRSVPMSVSGIANFRALARPWRTYSRFTLGGRCPYPSAQREVVNACLRPPQQGVALVVALVSLSMLRGRSRGSRKERPARSDTMMRSAGTPRSTCLRFCPPLHRRPHGARRRNAGTTREV